MALPTTHSLGIPKRSLSSWEDGDPKTENRGGKEEGSLMLPQKMGRKNSEDVSSAPASDTVLGRKK